MSAVRPLLKEITHYLERLNEEQQKVMLNVVKSFAEDEAVWSDKKLFTKMDEIGAKSKNAPGYRFLDDEDAGPRHSARSRRRGKS